MNKHILLVEDDQNFGDVLRSYLEMHDFDVTLATDGEAGLETFKKGSFDLCIFDVMMPKKDGFTLAREVKAINPETMIIFLTAKTLKEDVLEGFKLGADDYITKPFNSEELLFRVRAVLRRNSKNEPSLEDQREFIISDYHFDYALRILTYTKDGTTDKLSPKEAQLLRLFCFRMNDVLQRSEALTKIWNDDNYFTARSMDVFITKIRKYLSKDSKIEIENIHGNGFRMYIKPE
ncbi:MAG: response regulator transcription factor [Saprospiraceae bacterium]|nr:response regulator transcription factor [Saprospiraceae bacterium]MBK6564588.1 response regulator transcription factor [Saprospiraceae bacterium]MBK7523229.1 response regulator transcription factor [Saprospiraceae bacterium]MBK8371781.1 response regulator transcription factor [Saprospiraceae bacterium]MBK8819528.1 response regulator transcription factor [Saprospiraceae bacterium]